MWTSLTVAVGLMMLSATASSASCNFSASAPWTSAKKFGLKLGAYSVGEKCGKTAVVLTVSNAKGEVIWSTTRQAQYVLTFAQPAEANEKGVKASLKQWLDPAQEKSYANTKMLGDWPKGADAPPRDGDGEFGYFPQADMSREDYLDTRTKALPMFCFVQGFESQSCIIARDATSIEEFGGISFPG